MGPGTILIRADASVEIGTGHVMRCLALAQAWQDQGGEAVFALAKSTSAIMARLAAENCEVLAVPGPACSTEDADWTVDVAVARGANWVVTDGYSFHGDYQRRIKDAGLRLLYVDDNADSNQFVADLVLNQNLHARAPLYRQVDPKTQLLLGPKFTMLRREFGAWRNWKREVSPVGRRVLVMMGGSDPENLSAQAIRALSLLDSARLEVTMVAGGSNPYVSGLRDQIEKLRAGFRLEVDAKNMPELMAGADLAVSSAGSICWEMCMLGLPAIVIDAAPNQLPLAQELERRKVAIHIPRASLTVSELAQKIQLLINSSQIRSSISKKASALVDGRGATRVIAATQAPAITLRPVQASDCHLLWEWANDPCVRSTSFSPTPITWEQHQVWFTSKMKDRRCLILIGEDEQAKPFGQFRMDLHSELEGEVDVCVTQQYRGIGYGSRLIDLCVREVFAKTDASQMHAFILPENHASIRAFEGAYFTRRGDHTVKGKRAVHYVRTKE